jgi:hypothetical protein
METISLTAAIIGATAAIKQVFPEKVYGFVTIIVAVLLGLIAGLTGFQDLTWVTGIFSAFIAVGTVHVAQTVRPEIY